MTFNPAALAAGLQQAFSSVGNAMMQKEAERLAYQRALDKYQYQLQHKYDNPIDRALAEAQLAQLRRAGSGGDGDSSGRLPNGLTPYQDAMLNFQYLISSEQAVPYSDIIANLPEASSDAKAQQALAGILASYSVRDPQKMAESLVPVFYNKDDGWFSDSFKPNPAARGKIVIKPGLNFQPVQPQQSAGKTFK